MKQTFALAAGWLLFISVLFCLPGAALPAVNWLDGIWFDKWVHLGLFAVLVFLWCRALRVWMQTKLWWLLGAAIMYGLLVEVVQHYFIANRSFDWGDLMADAAGSAVGLWFGKGIKK